MSIASEREKVAKSCRRNCMDQAPAPVQLARMHRCEDRPSADLTLPWQLHDTSVGFLPEHQKRVANEGHVHVHASLRWIAPGHLGCFQLIPKNRIESVSTVMSGMSRVLIERESAGFPFAPGTSGEMTVASPTRSLTPQNLAKSTAPQTRRRDDPIRSPNPKTTFSKEMKTFRCSTSTSGFDSDPFVFWSYRQ